MRSMAELAKRARCEREERVDSDRFLGSVMKFLRVVVAPMAFSHAITERGLDSVRAVMALAITGAINFRMFGPTAQVTWRACQRAVRGRGGGGRGVIIWE